jgi:hypothetical protein
MRCRSYVPLFPHTSSAVSVLILVSSPAGVYAGVHAPRTKAPPSRNTIQQQQAAGSGGGSGQGDTETYKQGESSFEELELSVLIYGHCVEIEKLGVV